MKSKKPKERPSNVLKDIVKAIQVSLPGGQPPLSGDEGDTGSFMREVILTRTFLDSVSAIVDDVVSADNSDLQKIIHQTIRISECGLAEKYIDPVCIARMGGCGELAIFFLRSKRRAGLGSGAATITKYTFLLAVASDFDDDEPSHDDGGPTNGKRELLRQMAKAAAATAAVGFARRVVRRIAEIVEADAD